MNDFISRCWECDPKNCPYFEEISKELLNEVRKLIEKALNKDIKTIEYFIKGYSKRNISSHEEGIDI